METKTDVSPILRLKLKEAFSDFEVFKQIISDDDYFLSLFEHDTKGSLFVMDDSVRGHSVFVSNTNGIGRDKTFFVNNPKHTNVFLWHIDGVLYEKNSKCDCALLTDNILYFVEFKSNAVNRSESAEANNYNKASNQLLSTYLDVRKRCFHVDIDLRNMVELKAFAVFNKSIPRNSALCKKVAADFLFKSKGVKLSFENQSRL